MNEDLKISIIVPIYNVEEYLRDCVQSLVNQTYRNIEIVLVDDGSTDSSVTICDELKEQDERILVFHKPNGRTASARNLGVKESSGEYVLFVDPDDWFDVRTIELIASEIERSKVDVLRFNYIREYGEYSQKKENTLLEPKIYDGEEYREVIRKNLGLIGKELHNIENFNFLASVCFGCYKRSIIIENDLQFVDIDKIGSFSDGLFNLQYLLSASSFVYLDEYLYHYRKNNSGSYTNKSKKDFFEKSLILFEEIQKAVQPKEMGELFEQAYFNRIAYCVLELNLNAMKNLKAKFKVRYKEIKTILSNDLIKLAIKQFNLKYLPLKWKVYYLFVKMRWTFGVYVVSKAILYLKGKK